MIFNPLPHEWYVAEVWSDPHNRHYRREEDHSLYVDLEAFSFFIVESIEHVSGPNVSCSHLRRTVADYVAGDPERQVAVRAAIEGKLSERTAKTP